MRIAIDAMGGDNAPFSIVAGTVMGYRVLESGVRLMLVGSANRIKQELINLKADNLPIEVIDAPETIDMSDSPIEAIKQKKNSSINIGLRLQKEGKADAFISAGNTGAVMASSLLTLGRLKGVSRPAIATLFPTVEGVALVLDVGANSDCKSHHLSQFGIMGAIYSKFILKVKNPKVGLLSIGEEQSKGNELTIASHKLLDSSAINFCGNVEGRDILKGTVDVVVCDGFVGNIILKFAESTGSFFSTMLKKKIRGNLFANIGALLMTAAFRSFKQSLDSAEYGGAPLLGINGVCIICHGSSSPKAIKNAILVSVDVVRKKVNKVIQEKITSNGFVAETTADQIDKLL
ncbi:MAG: phosphate acyltransferase PlsX [candidate division Zixibacteria bacterium]|nr:phosphate acyltransferase PlsX [candidate division Zixibacteria bacterium]